MSRIMELPPVERPKGNSALRAKPDRPATGSWDLDACTHVPGRAAKIPPGRPEIPEDVNRARMQLMAVIERGKTFLAKAHTHRPGNADRGRPVEVLRWIEYADTATRYANMAKRLKNEAMKGYLRAAPRERSGDLTGLAVNSEVNKIKAIQD